MKRPNPKALAKEVEDFNLHVPVGSPVVVTKDMGEQVETRTRSEAWVMGGHTAMVMVDGIPGGYLLSRVKASLATGDKS